MIETDMCSSNGRFLTDRERGQVAAGRLEGNAQAYILNSAIFDAINRRIEKLMTVNIIFSFC